MDIKAIHSYLESSNLEVIVELTLDKYQGRDYYLSIVYDNEISKYKVLYLPINIVDYKKLDKYLCFQFIDQYYINYLIKNINDFKDEFKYVKARNYKNKYMVFLRGGYVENIIKNISGTNSNILNVLAIIAIFNVIDITNQEHKDMIKLKR